MRFFMHPLFSIAFLSFCSFYVYGQLIVDVSSKGSSTFGKSFIDLTASIQAAAKLAADSILSMYIGNQPGQVPGIFLPTNVYYWWLGGGAWNVFHLCCLLFLPDLTGVR